MKKKTTNEFIADANKIFKNKYDYSGVVYEGLNYKVLISCPIHGEFKKIARDHLNGQGCPICSKKEKYSKKTIGIDEFINRGRVSHNDKYDYSSVEYVNAKTPVKIICPKHGEFEQRPDVHIKGEGCKKCYLEKRGLQQRFTTNDLVNKLISIHGDKYDYSNISYDGYYNNIIISCPKHGEFKQLVISHINGGQCPKCNSNTSAGERELSGFLNDLNFKIINNSKSIIKNTELDIYIPSNNVAIEYNGLYWHCELFKDSKFHLNKTELCNDNGIKLIHIFEDEWLYKKEIVKSRLMNILGVTTNKIYGRHCEIKEINHIDKKNFLNKNHIQGDTPSNVNIGLYHNNELVSLMCFGKRPVINKSEWELIRFCNKLNTNVIGGASKLLKHFIKIHNPKEIISYADRRWSTGDLYDKLGFKFVYNSKPNWFVIDKNKRYHRIKYQKHKLIKNGFDETKTAHQICLDNNIYRIYDCGSKKYVMSF